LISKEWRDVRWKLLTGALLVLAIGVMIPLDTLHPTSYSLFGEPGNVVAPSPGEDAGYLRYLLWSQWFSEASGNPILMVIATLLGAALISDETRRGSIFLLLSRPVSRSRVLLIKYAINAGVLLAIVALGSAALLGTAGVLGHPQDAGGVLVSAVLMWFGLLFVLGTSLTLSVALDNTLLAIIGTFLVWVLTSVTPAFVAQQIAVITMSSQASPPAAFFETLSLSPYWTSLAAYSGDGFPTVQLLVSSITAAVPLLVALWLFNRRAY
jgi:ABC-type transport system involved in multi-copper enzyme maturation permease subunit